MDVFYYLFVIFVFLAVAGFVEGMFLGWNAHSSPGAKRIEHRLQTMSPGVAAIDSPLLKNRVLSVVPTVERLLLVMPRIHVLDRILIHAGSKLKVAAFLGVSAAFALVPGAIAFTLSAPMWLLAVVMATGALAPLAYMRHLGQKRLLTIDKQLPDAMDLMARAMRAGHAFSSALQMVATEGPEPIAGEFRTTFEEINFGVSMQDAMVNLAARVESADLRHFVVAVTIQRETGGNLAELLTSIAALSRDRVKLAGTVRVLSSEGRLSAWILGLLPFVLAGVLNVVNPKFMIMLWTDPAGIKVVIGALGLMLLGVIWMWRIIAIRI